jgi:hypothetical protein
MNKILEIKFGSHLYGTNTPESDMDFKGIYLPEPREIILGTYKKTIQIKRAKKECERNTKDDVDLEIFSLDRFLELLTEGQTVALDMVFAPDENCTFNYENINIWRAIKLHRHELLTKNVNAFVGYARQQAAKYGIKGSRMDALKRVMALLDHCYENGEAYVKLKHRTTEIEALVQECQELVSLEKLPLVEIVMLKAADKVTDAPHLQVCGRKVPLTSTIKFAREVYGKILDGYGQRSQKAHLAGGVDWKALSHAVRVNGEALELLRTGHITFPRPDRDLLLQIKTGKLPYEQVAELIEKGLADLYEAHAVSVLPNEPNTQWYKDLVFEAYSRIVKYGSISSK